MPFPFDGFDDISPSRTELLIGGPPITPTDDGDGLWMLSIPGGQARRVGSVMAYDSTFTPDGTAIYYGTGPYIFKANTDGSQPRKVLTAKGIPFYLRFSPDGHLLRFSLLDPKSNTTSLWEAYKDGSHLRRLFVGWSNATSVCCGSWTSDGKYYLFQAVRGGVTDLWSERVTGDWWRKVSHEPVQLTMGQMNSEAPLPSRDGTKVFFIGAARREELERYEPATRSFTTYLPGLSAEDVAFTRDGKRVAYVSFPDGTLWQSKADGSHRHELTFPPMQAAVPRWSPDGTQIAFSARQPTGTWQIFVVSAEGGHPEQVTSADSGAVDPTWSPDGDSLAFGEQGNVAEARGLKEIAIHIVNLKTRQVTTVPDSTGLFPPRWSPDGRYLLAVATNYQKLKLYDFTTRKWEDLVKMPLAYPNWSSDGKCAYFDKAFDTSLPIFRICLSDRKLQHVLNLSDAGELAFGKFGLWWGLGPDDSILTVRDIGTQEIYALNVKFPQ